MNYLDHFGGGSRLSAVRGHQERVRETKENITLSLFSMIVIQSFSVSHKEEATIQRGYSTYLAHPQVQLE